MVDYFHFLWAEMEIILSIHFYPHGRSQRHFMNKFHKQLFLSHQIKSFIPSKKDNCMHGLKSAILAISQKLVQPSISKDDRKWLHQLLPIKYELKLPSEVMPVLLPFRSRSKQCGAAHQLQ